jgi:GPH family glycoside/pentoside/hexuronide:cation symporter
VPQTDFRTILLYANGNFGKSCLANLVEIYALFYFTDLLGINPAVAGFALLASLVLDALTDPLVGHIGDRWQDRFQTLVPYAFVGAPLTVVSFLILFIAPERAGASAALVAIIGLLGFRVAYTIFDVPHNGLLAVVTRTPEERTTAASLRIVFSALGKLTVTLVIAWLIEVNARGVLDASGLASAAILLAVLFVLSVTLTATAVRRVRIRTGGADAPRARFADIARAITGNRSVLIIFILTAINSLMVPTIAAAFIYYAKYGLANEAIGTRAVMVLASAQTLSLLFWATFTNRVRNKAGSAILAYLIFALSAALGLWIGDDTNSILLIAGLVGFAVGGIFMLNWSMLPDALERKSGLGPPSGTFGVFGVYTLTNKAFSGLAQAYVGLVLALVGFSANTELAPGVIDSARMGIFALPLLGACLCLALLYRFERAG